MTMRLSWLAGDKQQEADFDAVVTETATRSATITSHPVEKGADVSDHVQIEPFRLSIEGVVTSTPVREPPNFTGGARGETSEGVLKFDRNMERPKLIYSALTEAMKAKALFTVYRSHARAENMIITSLSVPREAGSGHATENGTFVDKLTFSIEMQQIRVVSSRNGKVTRKPKTGTPKKKDNKGDSGKKDATESESAAHSAGSAAGFFH